MSIKTHNKIPPIEVVSIPTKGYGEVIEIRVPTRFYWDKDGTFDGIEFGEFKSKLESWQTDMINRCLNAVIPAMSATDEDSQNEDD